MKKFIAMLICAGIFAAIMVGCSCGGSETKTKKTSSATTQATEASETTKVIETTADGGTVEEDKDGNRIVKDSDGGIISVTDKNGNEVDVDEYVASHPGTKKSVSAGKTSSDTKSKTSSSSKSSSGSESDSSSSSNENVTEGEIPTVIVTMPDDEDLETAPELPDL